MEPEFTIVRNVIEISSKVEHSKGYPWRPNHQEVNGIEFVELDATNSALRRCAGLKDAACTSWIVHVAKVRDRAIDKAIAAVFDADADRVRPKSLMVAYEEANIPSIMNISVKSHESDDVELRVLTTGRKHTNPFVELTDDNVALVVRNITLWSGDTEPVEEYEEEADDQEEVDEDTAVGEMGHVRWKQNRGRWSLKVSWRDEHGATHSKWATPSNGNVKQIIRTLNEAYDHNNVATAGDSRTKLSRRVSGSHNVSGASTSG